MTNLYPYGRNYENGNPLPIAKYVPPEIQEKRKQQRKFVDDMPLLCKLCEAKILPHHAKIFLNRKGYVHSKCEGLNVARDGIHNVGEYSEEEYQKAYESKLAKAFPGAVRKVFND